MPTRRELYAEIAERNRATHRKDRRDALRFWIGVLLACFVWSGAGLGLGAWAFHVTDPELGHILLLAGQIVTWAGVLGTVTWALHKSADRGWR